MISLFFFSIYNFGCYFQIFLCAEYVEKCFDGKLQFVLVQELKKLFVWKKVTVRAGTVHAGKKSQLLAGFECYSSCWYSYGLKKVTVDTFPSVVLDLRISIYFFWSLFFWVMKIQKN